MEIGVPLTLLGIAGEPVAPDGGYVFGGARPSDRRTYFLRAGQVVGGAAWSVSRKEASPASVPFDENDPRTWETWVFVRH